MRFLDYIFYRSTRFYKRWGESHPEISGQFIVWFCLGSFIISIINIFLYVRNIEVQHYKTILIVVCIPLVIICSLVFSSRRYVRMHERWKDEKCQGVKGWLVFGFVVMSFVIYCITVNYKP